MKHIHITEKFQIKKCTIALCKINNERFEIDVHIGQMKS